MTTSILQPLKVALRQIAITILKILTTQGSRTSTRTSKPKMEKNTGTHKSRIIELLFLLTRLKKWRNSTRTQRTPTSRASTSSQTLQRKNSKVIFKNNLEQFLMDPTIFGSLRVEPVPAHLRSTKLSHSAFINWSDSNHIKSPMIRNQGNCQSSYIMATVGAIESWISIKFNS